MDIRSPFERIVAPPGGMNAGRILYRARQFWQVLGVNLSSEERKEVRSALTPTLYALFNEMNAAEQAHAIRVWRALLERGEHQPDLLVAALLHDVGKSRFPLFIWERVCIVLVKMICPSCMKRWSPIGRKGVRGWRRAFIIAEHHPAWGAEMVSAAGASPLSENLIRRHQENVRVDGGSDPRSEVNLLKALQMADDES
jgi:hypothetical protein